MNDRFRFRCFDNEVQKFVVGFKLCDHYKWPNGIIEQCTGLKDKNGKLIYEGDILALPYQAGWQPILGFVKFDEKEACFLLSKNEKDKTPQSFWWNEGKEVIGNIHENPELLEVEK